MTATARAEAKTVDWQLWVPGVAVPIACFLVDFAAGEYVLQFAPAALLSLAAIGIASLVISRNQRRGVAGLATVGPMWMVGGVTLALGIPLAVVSCLGLFFSFVTMWRNPQDALLLAWALLGLTPLWTAATYLTQASALTKVQVARRGRLKTSLFGLVGAVTAISIVIGAQIFDSWWINKRLAALDKEAPHTWQAGLQSLNAYPLCGRQRCRREVCRHLFGQFGRTPPEGYLVWPDVPTPIDNAFKQAYGVAVSEACRRYD